MDRALTEHFVQKRRLRRIFRIGIPIIVGLALIYFFSSLIKPSVDRNDLRTASVQRGGIEGTIAAAGTIVPIFEQVISSPVETRLLGIRKRPGEVVNKGESILELDPSELNLSMERAEKLLKVEEHHKVQLRLDIERSLNNLDGQLHIKNLRLEYLKAKTAQGKKMMDIGAISSDQFNQIKLEEEIARIEKSDLESSVRTTKLSLQNQLDGVTAEIRGLLKEKNDIQRQLQLLSCEADRDGVVTWIRDEIGSTIHRGEIVLRVADLRSYRVDATLSDIHFSKMIPGMEAIIRMNDTMLAGRLETVYPNVENGTVRIRVSLENAAHPSLRPNLRVDVALVTNRLDSVLTLKKGSYMTGGTHQELYIVKGNTATKVSVVTGLIGLETIEILGGLSEGDEAIISDMSSYSGASEITIH